MTVIILKFRNMPVEILLVVENDIVNHELNYSSSFP